MTPVIGDLIQNTVGKVVGGLVDKYLPKSMSEKEKADFTTAAKRLTIDELEANKSIIEAVNETMRAETKAEDPWTRRWRPFWGYISGLAFFVVCVFVCILMYEAVLGDKPESLSTIPQVITAFSMLFAIPGAILGVTAWHRGKMQRVKAGETQ